ncbi:MAG: hypothetical protein R3F59_31775 [Myxococcota bacterium]
MTWSFTAPADGDYRFDTTGSSFDPVLLVLDGCDGRELGCNDDADPDLHSVVDVALAAGQTVVVVVDGYEWYDHGDYALQVY